MTADGDSHEPTRPPVSTALDTDAALTGPTGEGVHRASTGGLQLGPVIGRGGMGEVLLARDAQLGRDVAIKRMLHADPSDEALGRFLREARIQARLDHPAIVPVHQLGFDDEGRPYFTMKRLAGTTLHVVLGDPEVSLQRLLRAFVDVCLAIELAHTRNIVHRDLKPANIMLGDFGEVYVLDWGLARVTSESDRVSMLEIPALDGETQLGAVLGTPGYMAPEQARGELAGQPADVYALGCILFEILTREPLHRAGSTHVDRPRERSPDRAIAPELDAICADATEHDPAARPAARVLAKRVERYLDGDRDLEQRRTIAAEMVEQSRESLAAGDRATAMQAAGRALVLDPTSRAAGTLVSSLLLEPPLVLPATLERHLVEVDRNQERQQYRISQRWQLAFLLFLPLVVWQGATSWWTVAAVYALIMLFVVVAQIEQRRARPHVFAGLLLSAAPMFVMPRVLGPFLIAPGILGVMMASWAAYPSLLRRPATVIATLCAPIGAALVLEGTGLLSSTWHVDGGSVSFTSAVLEIGGAATGVFLIASTIVTLVVCGLLVHQVAVERHAAQRTVEIYAWHLRQLLPLSSTSNAR